MAAEPAARQTGPVVVLTTVDSTERVVVSDDPDGSIQQIDHHMLVGGARTPVEPSIVLPVPDRICAGVPARGVFRPRSRPTR